MSDETVRADVLQWLKENEDEDIPDMPDGWSVEHWRLLANEHPDLQFWIAHQKNAPEAVIRELLEGNDSRVRWRIAAKRNLPPDLFPVLAADADPAVRCRIACNAKTPIEIVEQLTHDPLEFVWSSAKYSLDERLAKLAKKKL